MISENHLEMVKQIIEDRNGLKATELAALPECYTEIENLSQIIEELVRRGWIVEVEYVLPNVSYRIKSFLLPKGTTVNVRGL